MLDREVLMGWSGKRMGREREAGVGERTAGMCTQYVTDGFCVGVYAVNAGNEVATVALEEDAVFGPVVVFVVFVPCALE
jgi:hypothetical protein